MTNNPTDHAHLAEMAFAGERDAGRWSSLEVSKEGRRIKRWVDAKLLEEMARRVRARPQIMRQRQQLSEPPFGKIKRAMGRGYFLMKGLQRVGAEMILAVLRIVTDNCATQDYSKIRPHQAAFHTV